MQHWIHFVGKSVRFISEAQRSGHSFRPIQPSRLAGMDWNDVIHIAKGGLKHPKAALQRDPTTIIASLKLTHVGVSKPVVNQLLRADAISGRGATVNRSYAVQDRTYMVVGEYIVNLSLRELAELAEDEPRLYIMGNTVRPQNPPIHLPEYGYRPGWAHIDWFKLLEDAQGDPLTAPGDYPGFYDPNRERPTRGRIYHVEVR